MSGTPAGLATPGAPPDLHAIAELSELDSDDDGVSVIGSMPSSGSEELSSFNQSQSLSLTQAVPSPVGQPAREGTGDSVMSGDVQHAVQVQTGSDSQDSPSRAQSAAVTDNAKASTKAGPDDAAGGEPGQASSGGCCCCCRGVLLREGDADVVAASAVAHDAFALRRLVIASDPIWQPVAMRKLLHMAVFGQLLLPEEAQSDTQEQEPRQLHDLPAVTDASGDGAVLAQPRRVLFREVQVASLQQLSTVQYAAAWLAVRSEIVAVRLSRAWETRVPGWALMYVLSALHALNMITRILTGVGLRCPYVDPNGDWYWNFCTAE